MIKINKNLNFTDEFTIGINISKLQQKHYEAFMNWRSSNYLVEENENAEKKVKHRDVLGAQAMLLKIM